MIYDKIVTKKGVTYLKLTQMQYFEMVCRYQSVSRAAEELHLTQPSVSSSIRELEEEFGVPLFHRIKKRLILTSEGEYFLTKIRDILQLTDTLDSEMNRLGSQNNSLNLGVPPMIGTMLFPSMFKIFKPMYPDVHLDILEYGSRQTIELVENNVLDMAIVITNNLTSSAFNIIDILETQIVFCVHHLHPFSSFSSIAMEQLSYEPVILLKEDSFQNAILKQRFAASNIQPNILMYSNQLQTVERFVSDGIASAFLFSELVQKTPLITGIPLKEPISIKIGLIWKKEKKMHGSLSRFIDFTQHYKDYLSPDTRL